MREIVLSTSKEFEIIDITGKIQRVVKDSGVKEGIALVYLPHATAALVVNEATDPRIKEDIIEKAKHLFPKGAGYKHDEIDRNAHAHLISTFLGTSHVFPVEDGELKLGQWQSVSFLEADGPRKERKVYVELIEK